jgi:hypothetical protein
MTRVNVDEYLKHKQFIEEVNSLNPSTLELYDKNGPIPIPEDISKNWKFIGLDTSTLIDIVLERRE